MKNLGYFIIFALFLNGVAHASDRTATLSFSPSSPSITNLHFENIELKTKILPDGSTQTLALIHGTFDKDESHIVINNLIVKTGTDGQFSVGIPIEKQKVAIVIRAVDFAGNIQTEQGWILSEEPVLASRLAKTPHLLAQAPRPPIIKPVESKKPSKPSKTVVAAKAQPPTPKPESKRILATIQNVSVDQEPVQRPSLLSTSLGYSSLSYSEVGGIDFSETAIRIGLAYEQPLFPRMSDRWSLGASGGATLFPLSETGSSLGMRLFNAEIFASYSFTNPHSVWDFSVRGGVYYSSTSVSGNAFGFTNMFGPEVYPMLSRLFANGATASVHFKYAPVIDLASGFTFSSNALDAGLSYATAPRSGAWVFSGDYQKLNANVEATSVQLSGLSLSIGRTF